MKKIISRMLLAALICFGLTACGSNGTENSRQQEDSFANNETEKNRQDTETEAEDTESTSEKTNEEEQIAEERVTEETASGQSGTLVVYFSCTGTTKGLAEAVANEWNADLYEIVPEEPYKSEDLDYNDDNSRSTKEMEDSSSRPAISGSVENMEQYDRIILGYPIWWGEAPRIVSTFVESYDFSGKTIIPFCTSGGSGIGSSSDTLETLAGNGTWLEGKRFSGGESGEDVIKSLGIE